LQAAFFHSGRVPFLRRDGTVAKQNPFDSVIYLYNVDLERVIECFDGQTRPCGKPMGKLMEMKVI